MVLLFYTTYISVDLAYHEIFRAKVGKGGIIDFNLNIFPLHKVTIYDATMSIRELHFRSCLNYRNPEIGLNCHFCSLKNQYFLH